MSSFSNLAQTHDSHYFFNVLRENVIVYYSFILCLRKMGYENLREEISMTFLSYIFDVTTQSVVKHRNYKKSSLVYRTNVLDFLTISHFYHGKFFFISMMHKNFLRTIFIKVRGNFCTKFDFTTIQFVIVNLNLLNMKLKKLNLFIIL